MVVGGVICGVWLLRLCASDFLLYPTTPVYTLYMLSAKHEPDKNTRINTN